MARQIIGDASEWSGALKDLFRQIDDGSITLAQLQAFVQHCNPFGGDEAPEVVPTQPLTWSQATAKAYGLMGLGEEYAQFNENFLVEGTGDDWELIILPGVTHANLKSAIKKAGSDFWSAYDNPDKSITVNDRDADRDGQYAIAIRATVEADEENANKSADRLKAEHHKGMTTRERLFAELVYFLMTDKHLDIRNYTLCSGSRDDDGSVPHFYFNSDYGEVCLGCWRVGHSRGSLRSRSVRVLPVKSRQSGTKRA